MSYKNKRKVAFLPQERLDPAATEKKNMPCDVTSQEQAA
jgi:hypothetical protein